MIGSTSLTFHRLSGDARERGLLQAAAAGADRKAVRVATLQRIGAARSVLETKEKLTYLSRQMDFARRHCAPELAELEGLSDGYELAASQVFALLHLSILSGRFESDGCTAFAQPLAAGGALLAKNRDLSGLHRNFQGAFVHEDPAFAAGHVFALGTFGVPGVYSSGLNAAGLALADTAISAPVHGVGWLRYLLMTRILSRCTTVEAACDMIASVQHAGGGSLILADASGAVAAVELLADGARIDRTAPAFRTNHFRCEPPEVVANRLPPLAFASTRGRSDRLAALLDGGLGSDGPESVRAALGLHARGDAEAFCRHGEGDGAHTVSGVIYHTLPQAILLSSGAPCAGDWRSLTMRDLGKQP